MDSQTDSQKPPSAQIVGQEFVKQYYTMLNAAPGHLHRFYSNNSSFIHGSADGRSEEQQAVTGQVEIHKKIMSLNFNNCHARICQVDSQSCVGGSVVVQVIGELSNDGQPMHRFVQTFVLAPQSAKKYYVHSDIFCYLDVYFPAAADSGCVEANTDYVDEEAPGEDMEQMRYDGTAAELDEPNDAGTAGYEELEQEPAADSGCDLLEGVVSTPAGGSAAAPPGETGLPSGAGPEASGDEAGRQLAEEIKEPVEVAEEEQAAGESEKQQQLAAAAAPVVETVSVAPEKVVEPAPPVQPVDPPKPLTWAAMASRGGAGGAVRAQPVPSGGARPAPVVAAWSPQAATPDARLETNVPGKPAVQRPAMAGGLDERNANGRPVMNGDNSGPGVRRSVGGGFGPSSPQQTFPDNQQVFIGNLPQAFNDRDVIEFFEKFGRVMDFRINRKPGGGSGGNNVGQKNFGFMVFENAETVQKVLSARPIFMKKCRLNIEEKKPKEELAAARFSAAGPPRYPSGGAVRVGDGPVGRRSAGGYGRPALAGDVRSNSSDDGRV